MQIIVGAGGTAFPGWRSFNQEDLDIRNPMAWSSLFLPNSLDSILADHVWEHLTYPEGLAAARNAERYLKSGGLLRIAVPDGNHPHPGYLEWVRPGNWINGDDHKVLYTAQSLSGLLQIAGFRPVIRETFDGMGNLWRSDIDPRDGYLYRSCDSLWSGCLSLAVGAPYTSLIIDGVKA